MVLHASEECSPYGPFQKTQNTSRTLDLRDAQDHLYALIRKQSSLENPDCLFSLWRQWGLFRRTQQVSASSENSETKRRDLSSCGIPTSSPLHPQPSFRHLSGLCTSEFILSYLDEWRRSQGSTPLEASTHAHLFQRATPSLCTPARLPGPTLCCKRTK